MSDFNHNQNFTLTSDQSNALNQFEEFLAGPQRVFILQGYAGSGKTTLIRNFVASLEQKQRVIQLMAPTGRASKVIQQKTNLEASTIHSGIYNYKELEEIPIGSNNEDVTLLFRFGLANDQKAHRTIYIIDEASMVSDVENVGEFFQFGSGRLLKDLFDYAKIHLPHTESKIIFVGDPAQLPPVGMNSSPALDANYIKEHYGLDALQSLLKEVKRQDATNSILSNATRVRQSLTAKYYNYFQIAPNPESVYNIQIEDFLKHYNAHENNKVVICYKNKTAVQLNQAIRKGKFGEKKPIQATDTIIVGNNNQKYGVMNGDFGVVSHCSDITESREISFNIKGGGVKRVWLTWRDVELQMQSASGHPIMVSGKILENFLLGEGTLSSDEFKALDIDFVNRHGNLRKNRDEALFMEKLQSDPYFNAIQLKYGYAVTCHKAQGGEWANTFIIWDYGTVEGHNFYKDQQSKSGRANSDFYRWAYTAITRASSKLYCVNPPHYNPYSEMHFVDTEVEQAFNNLGANSQPKISIKIDQEIQKYCSDLGVENASTKIQDHLLQRIALLKNTNMELVSWQRVGYEIRYTFKRDEEQAAFKYWVNGKDVFKDKFEKISATTYSQTLFDELANLFTKAQAVDVIRDNEEPGLNQAVFDDEVFEEQPYLGALFFDLQNQFESNYQIQKVEHFPYKERYTIQENGRYSVFDFEYNKLGFFGRVLPLENLCDSPVMVVEMRQIVNQLKQG